MADYPEIGDILEAVRLYAASHFTNVLFPGIVVSSHNHYRLDMDRATDKAAVAAGAVRVFLLKPDISKDLRSPKTTVFTFAVNIHLKVTDETDAKVQTVQNTLVTMAEEAYTHNFLAASFKVSPSIRTLRCINAAVEESLAVNHMESLGIMTAGLVLDIQRIRP